MKFIMSIIHTLRKCVSVLKMFLENHTEVYSRLYLVDNDGLGIADITGESNQNNEIKKQKLLTLLEGRLQHILKYMIKLAMANTSK